MENALIVTSIDKSAAFFSEVLSAVKIKEISILNSASETRRIISKQDFDIIIVDAPLPDESAQDLSCHIARVSLSQVILAVNSEDFDKAAAVCEKDGILTLLKPVESEILLTSLLLARSANNRVKRIYGENIKLEQKIEDIKIINRAKLMLISYLSLNEKEAHRFIEKQAMNLRSSKRSIAEGILKTYAS